jgi:outer membrane protein insertion porin family
MFSSVSINDEVDENYLNKIIKNLYETTFFKDISVKLNNEILLISVVENPLIENIVYKGLKAEKIQSKITTNLKLKSRSSYNEFELKKDKLMMLSNLKELGYNFSTVDVFIKNLNDNKIEIIYDIALGNKA